MSERVFSISKAAILTGMSRKRITQILAPLSEEPSPEQIVAAFVSAVRAETALAAVTDASPNADGLYSLLALADMSGTYTQAVKKALKGITPAVNKRQLKQYRLTQKNSAGKTVQQLLESLQTSKTSNAKTRAEEADAEWKELRNRKARRELVPYGEVVDGLQRVIHLLFQRTAVNREICKACRGIIAKAFNDVRNNSKSILRSN